MTTPTVGLLIVYVLTIGRFLDRRLASAEWPSRFPRVALLLWHSCAASCLLSFAAVTLALSHDVWERMAIWFFHADRPLLHEAYAGQQHVDQIWNIAIVPLFALVAWLVVDSGRRGWAARQVRTRLRLGTSALGVCTTFEDRANVHILQHDHPVACCLPGRGHRARVVLTTALWTVLDQHQIQAVVEHEVAHLRGRHHTGVLWAEVVCLAARPLGLLHHYPDQVARLSEMSADDSASAKTSPHAVASALLTLGVAGSHQVGVRPAALAMSGDADLERIRRLAGQPLRPPRRAEMIGSWCLAAALTLVPVVALASPAALLMGTGH